MAMARRRVRPEHVEGPALSLSKGASTSPRGKTPLRAVAYGDVVGWAIRATCEHRLGARGLSQSRAWLVISLSRAFSLFCTLPLEHTIEATEDSEREDDIAVLGLAVLAAQEIGDGPDKGRKIRVAHRIVKAAARAASV